MPTETALAEGAPAPQFTLSADTGQKISLADFAGKTNVVLYFYPKDDTPGCTKEACSFRDLKKEFEKAGAAILGVSMDSVDSHKKFKAKFKLTFPLLADEDGKVTRAYGVYKEKNMYGKKYWGIERTTFVINKQGKIAQIFPKVQVDGHDREVLGVVKVLK